MPTFEDYYSQSTSDSVSSTSHIDEHTDRWVDEGDQPCGYTGHCDVHTDEA